MTEPRRKITIYSCRCYWLRQWQTTLLCETLTHENRWWDQWLAAVRWS